MSTLWRAEGVRYVRSFGSSGEGTIELRETQQADRYEVVEVKKRKSNVLLELKCCNVCGLLRGTKKAPIRPGAYVMSQYLTIVLLDRSISLILDDNNVLAEDILDKWTHGQIAQRLQFKQHWACIRCVKHSCSEERKVSVALCHLSLSLIEHEEETGLAKCLHHFRLQDIIPSYSENHTEPHGKLKILCTAGTWHLSSQRSHKIYKSLKEAMSRFQRRDNTNPPVSTCPQCSNGRSPCPLHTADPPRTPGAQRNQASALDPNPPAARAPVRPRPPGVTGATVPLPSRERREDVPGSSTSPLPSAPGPSGIWEGRSDMLLPPGAEIDRRHLATGPTPPPCGRRQHYNRAREYENDTIPLLSGASGSKSESESSESTLTTPLSSQQSLVSNYPFSQEHIRLQQQYTDSPGANIRYAPTLPSMPPPRIQETRTQPLVSSRTAPNTTSSAPLARTLQTLPGLSLHVNTTQAPAPEPPPPRSAPLLPQLRTATAALQATQVSVGVQTESSPSDDATPSTSFSSKAAVRPIDLGMFVCIDCHDQNRTAKLDNLDTLLLRTGTKDSAAALCPSTPPSSTMSRNASLQSETWSTDVNPGEPVNINELTSEPKGQKNIVNYVHQVASEQIAPLMSQRASATSTASLADTSSPAFKRENSFATVNPPDPVDDTYMSAKHICTTLYGIHKFSCLSHCKPLGLNKLEMYRLCMELYVGNDDRKNWKALAELVGLTSSSVQVIDAFVQNIPCKVTATEIVLYHWQNMYPKHFKVPFNLHELKKMLMKIGRLDIVNNLPRDSLTPATLGGRETETM